MLGQHHVDLPRSAPSPQSEQGTITAFVNARAACTASVRHRKMTWPEFEYAGSAQMQNGDFNVEPMCNFGNAGVPNRIT